MDKTITVVIPSYNRADYIGKAINSVIQQTTKKWKLLILDDASTDQTIEKVTPYLKDPRIQLIQLPENKGISHVLNKALQSIDTNYFVQLDSDDWLAKDTLAQFSRAFLRKPNAALYYGNVCLWFQQQDGKWIRKKLIKHRDFPNKYDFLIYLTYMLHPRCYRTEALRTVGGWDIDDEFGGRIMEDRRICTKLIEKYPFHWINKVLYHRRKHTLQLTNKSMYQARNKLRKELVQKYLFKWGNKYRADFGYRNGLLIVNRLIPNSKTLT
ncbi:MAG TPA: glycosyltransferase family A protein [Bacillota bacterium]|nr:glycosyltransferase family A protein [Bacillota bacterium]